MTNSPTAAGQLPELREIHAALCDRHVILMQMVVETDHAKACVAQLIAAIESAPHEIEEPTDVQ